MNIMLYQFLDFVFHKWHFNFVHTTNFKYHTAYCTGDNPLEATENEVGDFFMKGGGEVNKKIEVVKKKRKISVMY